MVEGSILSPDKVFAAITSLPDREQVLLELAAGDSYGGDPLKGPFLRKAVQLGLAYSQSGKLKPHVYKALRGDEPQIVHQR